MKVINTSGSLRLVLVAALVSAGGPAVASVPGPAASLDDSRRMEQLAAIAVMKNEYLEKELAYSPTTRRLAEMALSRLEERAGNLSAPEFQVELAIVGALTDNAHSGLRFRSDQARTDARLPLRLLWLRDGLVVARAIGDASDLAGARVLKLEGRSPEAIYADAKVLLGGNDAMRRTQLPRLIESKGILHALGLADSDDRISFTVRKRDGGVETRVLEMLPVNETPPTAELERLWSPQPIDSEAQWKAALAGMELPLYLREADKPFRMVSMGDPEALYLQFRSNEDEGGISIARFLQTVDAALENHRPQHLIVDMRFNVGGNILLTMDFMRELPARADHVWLLVGPYTFSAGIVSAAAIVKHGENVTIVGDDVGDRMRFWSEGAFIDLPTQGYVLRYTDGQFNLRHGCTGEPACIDDMYPINVNGISLTPEVNAPLTVDDYLTARDPAMIAIIERIRKSSGK
jgi:hypothetical protein